MDTITPEPRPAWVAGRPERGTGTRLVSHPFDGSEVATVAVPGAEQIERAVSAATAAFPELRRVPAPARAATLDKVSRVLAGRAEELAEVITAESGKPFKWSETEVRHAASVFRTAADEARRLPDESLPATIRRVPRGPVLGISPFTFPLGLVAHKVAPALAVGAPIIVKPSPRTPMSALVLGEILAKTDLPEGAFSVLPLGDNETRTLVADPRLPVVSFTGSRPVSWSLVEAAPHKQVVLELGGDVTAVVLGDWPDLPVAAARIAAAGNYHAGQSGTAVRRVIVERSVADEFLPALRSAVRALHTGDPYDLDVEVGPVVDEAAAKRITDWIEEAVAGGAKVLTGGTWEGTSVRPTVLTDVPPDADARAGEIFGPVLLVSIVDSTDEALAAVNATASTTQAGVFTRDVRLALRASAELEAGRVIIGDVPVPAEDPTGNGSESVRAAMREFTRDRVTVFAGITVSAG